MSNPMDALRAAGIAVDALSAEQRNVLETLSVEEVATLTAIQTRVNAAGGDVEGQDVIIIL